MSFILDALRKSEAERQRQDGPTLLEMRPSRPQRRLPLWVIGLGILLLLNMAVLVWFLLRAPAETARAPAVVQTAPATPAPRASTPPAASAPTIPNTAPPAPLLTPGSSAPASSAPPATASTSAAPASPRAAAPAPPKPARPQLEPSDSAADLPDYARVSAGMPPLRLDLHSYSDQPQQRYALINMHKVQEGDTLPEGARVLQILPDGVVMSYQGTKFVLGRN